MKSNNNLLHGRRSVLDFELNISFDKWSIGFVSSILRQTNQTTMHSGSSRQGKLVFYYDSKECPTGWSRRNIIWKRNCKYFEERH